MKHKIFISDIERYGPKGFCVRGFSVVGNREFKIWAIGKSLRTARVQCKQTMRFCLEQSDA